MYPFTTFKPPLTSPKDQHGKIFTLAWNPLVKDILATAGDDNAVKIWHAKEGLKYTLTGHTQNTRALAWNYEQPWLLISGSWDSSIRLWNVTHQRCIHVANEHNADVYGLASHPKRPFVYVSSSRDTTMRVWTLEKSVASLMVGFDFYLDNFFS